MTFYDSTLTPAWNSVDFKHKFICVTSSLPLDILNIYWFKKIFIMGWKTLKSSSNISSEGLKDITDVLLKNKLLNNENLEMIKTKND
jgi:hypothetical protein